MMKFFVVLLALVAAVAAMEYKTDMKLDDAIIDRYRIEKLTLSYGSPNLVPLPDDRNLVSDKIIALLENARDQFHVGFPDAGIPPLDPLEVAHLQTTIYQPAVIKADFILNDITLTGLQSFIIENLNFKIVGLQVIYELSIPRLFLDALYRIDGKVAIFIPIYPSGVAQAEVTGINLKGVATLGTNDGYLYIKGFTTEIEYTKFRIGLSGILGDGVINTLFNWVLSQISDSVIQGQKDALAAFASEKIITIGNEFLKDVKLTDLIG